MQDLKLSQLQLLAKIQSTGSLSQAARELGLTVSAASRALKNLQTKLNDPLFVRTWKGMVPTQTTSDMMPVVQSLLDQFEQLEQRQVFRPETLSMTLTIGAADNAIVTIVRPVIQKILAMAPNINFHFTPLDSSMLTRLATGEMDFLLYPTVKLQELPTHYYGIKLYPIRRRVLVDKNHPLALAYAAGQELTVADFDAYPKVVVKYRDSSRDTIYNLDEPLMHNQRSIIEVPYFLGAPYFVENTQNTLLLSEVTALFFTRRMPSLTSLPAPWSQSNDKESPHWTRLIWHERNNSSPAMQWLRSVFAAYAGPIREQIQEGDVEPKDWEGE